MSEYQIYQGGCHCGAIRFEIRINQYVGYDCNCSICRKKGFLHLIIPPEQFKLISGEDDLTIYSFNTEVAQHKFCRICGIHAFYTPRSHPDQIDVNIRCLDGDSLSLFTIESFDGANWEKNVDKIQ
ncbi:MAG: GFA family protein [Gloeocapsa sp. DLM2.Bin57]|nr:MAG: GFA family protein [Gloeocapsa sp. DLM2.Bin57]